MQHDSTTRKTDHRREDIRENGGITRIPALATHLLQCTLCLLLIASVNSVAAQSPISEPGSDYAVKTQATLAVFTDRKARPMTDQQWTALVAALGEELASSSAEIRGLKQDAVGISSQSSKSGSSAQIQILRGDRITPGQSIENPVTVFLHGDCTILPHPPRVLFEDGQISGPLGWVRRNHGHIEPFVHVECGPLAQMLATRAYGHDRKYRDQLLAIAIARVILHEWIHIATQSPLHSRDGLAKAQFNSADLAPVAIPSATQFIVR